MWVWSVLALVLTCFAAPTTLHVLDSSCTSRVVRCHAVTGAGNSPRKSKTIVYDFREFNVWFSEPVYQNETSVLETPFKAKSRCSGYEGVNGHEYIDLTIYKAKVDRPAKSLPQCLNGIFSIAKDSHRRPNLGRFYSFAEIDQDRVSPASTFCSADIHYEDAQGTRFHETLSVDCARSRVSHIDLWAEVDPEEENLDSTSEEARTKSFVPPSIPREELKELYNSVEVEWLSIPSSNSENTVKAELLEVEVEAKSGSDYDDGKKDADENTWGMRTVNPFQSSCQLYFITPMSPPNCPWPFTAPPIIPVATIQNLMIKSAVGMQIGPIIQLSAGVFNQGGMLALSVANSVMLETESTVKSATSAKTNSPSNKLLSATIIGHFRAIFSPWSNPGHKRSRSLSQDVYDEIERQFKVQKARHSVSLRKDADFISFLQTGNLITPAAPSWPHGGNLAYPRGTSAVVTACRDSIASVMKDALLPSSGLGRLATMVIREAHDRVSYPTILRVQQSVVHGLLERLPQTLSQSVSDSAAEIAVSEATVRLLNNVTVGLTNTLTRSVTKAVSMSLAAALTKGSVEGNNEMGQADYYGTYYSNYFSGLFAQLEPSKDSSSGS